MTIPCLAVCLGVGCSSHGNLDSVSIPRPVHISIDDCGWQSGASLAPSNGPYRLGARDPTLEDYSRLSRIAQASGTRIVTLWVLSELDRSNICARAEYNQPLAPADMTERGLAWDNSEHVNETNLDLMSFMRENAAWLEFGLHGIRHEHWAGGVRSRAEFGSASGETWGTVNASVHLDCFTELLRQYYAPEENPFPVSFVPPDHAYPTDSSESQAESAQLHSFGVRFAQMPGSTRFESGIFFMDRDTSASPNWSAEAALPGPPPAHQSWTMTHLPNFYGREEDWIRWLSNIDARSDTLLPKSSSVAASQLLYSTFTHLRMRSDGLYLNTLEMPDMAYEYNLLGPVALKVKLDGHSAVALGEGSELSLVALYRDQHEHAVLMLSQPEQPEGRLTQNIFRVSLDWDRNPTGDFIDLGSSTVGVYALDRDSEGNALADVEVYGQQTFDWILPGFTFGSIRSDNPDISVRNSAWDQGQYRLTVTVRGRNMQGERGHLIALPQSTTEANDASAP